MEAILYLAKRPVAREEFYRFFPTLSQEDVDSLLLEIREGYEKGSALLLEEVAGGFRFTTRQELFPYLQGFFGLKKELRFSKAALETLAIIAYKQPVTMREISFFRGTQSSYIMKQLLEAELVTIAGRKKLPGNPLLYETSPRFLETFGLKGLEELPSMSEIHDLTKNG